MVTTPSYLTFQHKNFMLESINKYYLFACLPGISYKISLENDLNIKNNQLRFFESGDIINNINFDFKMKYENSRIYKSGIIKIHKNNFLNDEKNNGNNSNNLPKLSRHNVKTWPEITENNYETTLHNVISKFKNKPGHYVLIVGSCLAGEYETVKKKSIIYKKYDIIKKKLACFQNLARQIQNNTNNKIIRLQNFSSTIKKKQNCYKELIGKLEKKINTSNGTNKQIFQSIYNYLIDIYKENKLFELNEFIDILEYIDDLKPNNNKNNNQNNIELPNWFI
jgi:hypothetical protein